MILKIGKRYRNITRKQIVILTGYDEDSVRVINLNNGEEFIKPRYVFYQLYRPQTSNRP